MKITHNWLKQYVDFDWSPDELAGWLTMLGLEVEGVHKLAGEFEGVVVAQILSRDAVPGTDKLSVCKVNDGKGERTIICGAQNHKPGDKVPLILPNYPLPLKPGDKEPFVIKERKVFGITSQGMMCSPQELGLPDPVDGLLILPADAPVGQPFGRYLGRVESDVFYDLEITPNRPDLNSLVGIAREIAAVTGNELRIPDCATASSAAEMADDLVSVRIEDADLCPRYTARVVKGVKIGPSPDWLRSTLEKVGIRSISNVVDVTNYVMMEIGQPLHAFDYHLIVKGAGGKPTIVVRRARQGEVFITLDGQKRELTKDNLLIADEEKGIALAGVMGGQNTEISDRTVDVLIESAYFDPANVRRTSKSFGLRTDASYRFERGADISINNWAGARCAQLIIQTAGGRLAEGLVDAYPTPPKAAEITLRHQKTDELLGVNIAAKEQDNLLQRLGLELVRSTSGQQPSASVFRVPLFRVDLEREADLIEEVARLHGVDKIPATPPRGAIGANAFDSTHDEIALARRILTGLGLNEAQGQTLISNAEWGKDSAECVALDNPLSADMDMLRPSLLPGMLNILRHNLSHKNTDAALFEIGRVFTRQEGQIREERRLALAMTGQRNALFWSGNDREAKFDAFDLKGALEQFFDQFGMRGIAYARRSESGGLFIESAAIQSGKQQIGEMGLLSPALAKRYDLRDPAFLAEVNLDLILARRTGARNFKPLPAYPAIRRDVAMLVPEPTTHEAVLQAVKGAKPANLESVELFDVFRGKNVPEGQKSLAYAFTYRASDKTLTDAEANAAHAKIVEAFRRQLRAAVRE